MARRGRAAKVGPGGEANALLSKRLASDMFPLSTQVRFACVQAHEGIFRLRGRAFPETIERLLNEGRNAAEHPGSMADARARISETLGVLEALAANAPQADPEAPIAHALPDGMVFDLTAEQYVRDWPVPQSYFHVMIACALLRSAGVELGKADYVAHMYRTCGCRRCQAIGIRDRTVFGPEGTG